MRTKMYKLRFYHTSGWDRGNLDREEFFYSYDEMVHRYKEVFRHELYSLNPTAWKMDEETSDWKRLSGF